MQYSNFGKYIRSKRDLFSESLNDFAFECGIEPATLSTFERGKSDILFSNFVKIAKGFNMSPAELLTEFESKKLK